MSGGDLRGHGGHSEDSGFTYTDMKPQEKDAIRSLALGSDSSHEPSSLSPALLITSRCLVKKSK